MNEFKVIGLMSGTSLDGLDICYAYFKKDERGWSGQILKTKALDYNLGWRNKLAEAMDLNAIDLSKLDVEFAAFIGTEVSLFMKENNLFDDVDLIASHGHTVFHQPERGVTLQIGNGQVIADLTRKMVVCDFRSLDVSLGGQGAPLVPVGDQLLFSEAEACLNLGGIANISLKKNHSRIAFDIAPCNLPLNRMMRNQYGLEFDKNGELAAKGKLIPELNAELNRLNFYKQHPPKSLGVEWLDEFFYPILAKYAHCPNHDLLFTIVNHEVYQIGAVLNKYKIKRVLISGGGAFNTHFVESLKKTTTATIVVPNIEVIAFKEAYVFGFLGVLKVMNEINTLKSVTGASRDSSGGVVFTPNLQDS